MFIVRFVLPATLLALANGLCLPYSAAAPAHPDRSAVLSHDLDVELIPATHELIGRDRIDVEVPIHSATVTFSIAPTLRVESVALASKTESPPGSWKHGVLAFATDRTNNLSGHRVVVTLPSSHDGHITLVWNYRGTIDDSPKEPRHLRFITPNETTGHIGLEGVYLSGESGWYPDIDGSLSVFRLRASVPEGWTVVTQGRKQEETRSGGRTTSIWTVAERSEALTLVANKFVVTSRQWTSRGGKPIELSTYFFPDNATLAAEYLDATEKYLDAYIPILGEFPFDKFAVVENFFASGLGMPSFTLLGSGSIKRHYTQPYALGHEIVHSWIGNSVFNRAGHGNWVEGLTTYLANYYWYELTHDDRQAFEQRRLMLQGYSVYVEPELDYPVARFLVKRDEKDNAIGYQKSAFVFHQLRREIGDDAFWRGLKAFVERYRNRPADWRSIEAVFAEESRRDLRWFFEQWIERGGAPSLSLGPADAHLVKGSDGTNTWMVTVRLYQVGQPYQMAVPVNVVTAQGAVTRWVALRDATDNKEEFTVPGRPLAVQLDPDLTVFRRIARPHLPPMLNMYVTDRKRTVVRAFSASSSPLEHILDRIADQESSWPESRKTAVSSGVEDAMASTGSVLVLADPQQQRAVRPIVEESCEGRVRMEDTGFHINGRAYEGSDMAVLLTCHRARVPGSVVTILYGVSPEAVENVSRLLFYYGWQSYVVFKNGAAVDRGLWQTEPETKEVRIDATE